jgi:hypothetical protein
MLPARPYHARDKAKVEAGAQVVLRWVLAALRKRQFFSLAELNEAIGELREKLNRRLSANGPARARNCIAVWICRRCGHCRRSLTCSPNGNGHASISITELI